MPVVLVLYQLCFVEISNIIFILAPLAKLNTRSNLNHIYIPHELMSMSKEAMLTAQIEALKKAILKKDDDLKKQNEELFEVQTTLKCVESESVRASSGQLKSLTAQLRNSELMVKKATGEKQRLNSMLSKERKIRGETEEERMRIWEELSLLKKERECVTTTTTTSTSKKRQRSASRSSSSSSPIPQTGPILAPVSPPLPLPVPLPPQPPTKIVTASVPTSTSTTPASVLSQHLLTNCSHILQDLLSFSLNSYPSHSNSNSNPSQSKSQSFPPPPLPPPPATSPQQTSKSLPATQTAQTMPTSSSLLTQASQLPRGTNMTHMSHMSHLSHLTHTLTNVCETSATTTTTTTTSATINAESSCSRGGELLWESAEENATAQSSSYSSSLALRTYTAILGLHANEWSVADFVLQVVDNIVAAVLEGGMLVGVLLEVLGECVSGGEGMRVLEEVFRLGDEDTMDEDEDSVLEPVCEFAPEAVHKRIAGCFGGGENGSNVNNRQLTVDDVMRVMGLDVNSNSNYKGKAKALVRSLCKIFGGDDSDHSSNSSIDDINCSNNIARATSFLVEFTSRWNRKAAQFRVFEPLIRVLARGGVGATPTPFLMKAKVSVLQCLLLNEFLFSKFEVTRFVEVSERSELAFWKTRVACHAPDMDR